MGEGDREGVSDGVALLLDVVIRTAVVEVDTKEHKGRNSKGIENRRDRNPKTRRRGRVVALPKSSVRTVGAVEDESLEIAKQFRRERPDPPVHLRFKCSNYRQHHKHRLGDN